MENWHGWVFVHALNDIERRAGELRRRTSARWRVSSRRTRRRALEFGGAHSYEVAANWKVITENYHECYHCPLIHPELCQVTPPGSGENYDLPGAWVGGWMDLRDGMADDVDHRRVRRASDRGASTRRRVVYLGLFPNLLISPHPDYVMTHRHGAAGPGPHLGRVLLVLPGRERRRPVVRGRVLGHHQPAGLVRVRVGAARTASPHFRPGPFGPNEDAVHHFVTMVGARLPRTPLHEV